MMYEGLYAPLPDSKAYLQRIGYEEFQHPDLKELNQLIDFHQRSIPFENLDISDWKQEISLEIPALFKKIVQKKRGGFCFELNALFYALLKDLGYQVKPVMVRIVAGRSELPPVRHRASLVNLEGTWYYCDVGYGGPSPWGAVPLEEGKITQSGQRYFLTKKLDEYWWEISLQGNQELTPLFHVSVATTDPVDYLLLCKDCADREDSIFATTRIVNLRTKDGNLSIKNDCFTKRRNGTVEEQNIHTEKELEEILAKEFSIKR